MQCKLDRCVESCNTINDLSNKVYVLNKTEDLNLNVFNMITGINESKALKNMYHANINVNSMVEIVTQIKIEIMINVYVNVKSIICEKKIIFGILLHIVGKMENI